MILQAEAERKKRANILKSEGERIGNINIAEATKISAVLKAEGIAEAAIVKAKAQAEAIQKIDASLSEENGDVSAQFILAQKYIQAYRKTANQENTILMHSEP